MARKVPLQDRCSSNGRKNPSVARAMLGVLLFICSCLNTLMKKILIIQSRQRPEMLAAERAEYERAVNSLAHINFVTSLTTTLSWENPEELLGGYDGVIFGGSGEFDFDGGRAHDDEARMVSQEIKERVKKLVLYILKQDFPLLGICYGHQIIAEVGGVPVVNDHSQKKVGTFQVFLTDAGKMDTLFSQLPESFLAQYGHKDSASRIPEGAVLLANSPLCNVAAIRYGNNIYTMQFHPELTKDDVVWKLAHSPGYLPEGVSVDSIVRSSLEASMIIPKFIERVIG